MKKLLSLAAIVAIVTCTFAFTSKKTSPWCVRNAAGTTCQLATGLQQDDIKGTITKYWPAYINETQTPCHLASPSTQCITNIRLAID